MRSRGVWRAHEGHEARPRPRWFRALGPAEPPERIEIEGIAYQRIEVYKHDSWAATGLYGSERGRKVIVKFHRQQGLSLIPLAWFGRRMARREARFLDFAKLEPRLCRRAPQGLAAAISLQRMADGAQPLNGIAHGTVTVLRASTRHLAGLLADVEASFASSPSRRSLRQRSTEGALLVDGADEGG